MVDGKDHSARYQEWATAWNPERAGNIGVNMPTKKPMMKHIKFHPGDIDGKDFGDQIFKDRLTEYIRKEQSEGRMGWHDHEGENYNTRFRKWAASFESESDHKMNKVEGFGQDMKN